MLKVKTTTAKIIETVLPEVVVSEVKKLGRPVNENSVRQARLKELEAKRINGELRQGRPVNELSTRQIRLKELEMKKASGELRRGRPVAESSARQIRLKELELKRANGELRRGRPKMNVAIKASSNIA